MIAGILKRQIFLLQFLLRTCKQIVTYFLRSKTQINGDLGTSFLDIYVPENLMERVDPTDVGHGLRKEVKRALEMVAERKSK